MSQEIISSAASAEKSSVPIWTLLFWKAFWITMRPYLIFVSGAAGLLGMAFIPEPASFRLVLGFVPLFLSYGLGQALTDCFQMDTDTLSSPYRPLVRGVISRRQVLAVSFTGLGAGVLLLTALNPEILILGIMAMAGLLAYTSLKRTWWGGPPWNSWIVALLPLMGRLIQGDISLRQVFSPAAPFSRSYAFAVLAVFFGYANFVLMGYLKDISADRATGYRTFPVVFGWGATALGSDFLALAAAALACLSLASLPSVTLLSMTVFGAAILINLSAQVRIHRVRDENKSYRSIAGVVRSFVLYATAIILSRKPQWLPFLTIFYLWFEVTLGLRPEERQV
jgi:4-hydroxybenzoate polyprenyltransferase